MSQTKSADNEVEPAGQSKDWNFHPKLPIDMSPVFDVPPRPKAALRWLAGTWLKATPSVGNLVLAVLIYHVLWPDMVAMTVFSWNWVSQISLINFCAVLIVAGGLHLYLYTFAGQKMKLRFDVRPMERSQRFTFGYQVWDNMFWALAVGVPIWTAWVVGYFYLAANGFVPSLSLVSEAPVWFVLFFPLIRLWQSFHFFVIHRLIHVPVLFRNVHYLHHRNVNVGPWSGMAMHPVEHAFYFSSLLIHFVLPSHPIHVIFHTLALSIGALFSHSGFQKLLIAKNNEVKAGSFHHQLHHRFFECNYGNEEVPMDCWFDSFHDGTNAASKIVRARKRLIFSSK